jgi:hypothetical protein
VESSHHRTAQGAALAGVGFVVAAACLFAVNGTVSKLVLASGMSSLRLVEIRCAGAAVVLCLVALARRADPGGGRVGSFDVEGAADPGVVRSAGYRYEIEILHLLVSPGHNYFGRPKDGPGPHPTYDLDEVQLVAGKGIVGDRFFGQAAHLDAAVTLFAVEALEAVAAQLGLDAVPDPLLTRRNVVLRGADVNGLRGYAFAVESANGGARAELFGGRPAAPCAWMDRVLSPGAHAALRGRGGLRCRVEADGRLLRGPAALVSPVPLDPAAAGRAAIRTTPLP